jgi:hypothetical protein
MKQLFMRRTLAFLLVVLLGLGCTPAAPPEALTVVTHPDGPLYVGDQVSFEVFAPPGKAGEGIVSVNFAGEELGSAAFAPFGIGRRDQATLWWVWDTGDLEPGKYELTFTLASGYSWVEKIRLLPASRVPPPEPDATWASTTTECCLIYYITGTDAARDIASLSVLADEQSASVSSQMGVALQERIQLIFMPRVIGHGGFTWDGVYISYLDGNYVGNEMDLVLHHEFVHHYDNWIGGEYMPTILQEGLAVYLSGGHFKPEPIMARAAALLELGWYLPLSVLSNDFYNQQHDIGYLEAAALVQYLYETYGEGGFLEFYRTIPYPTDGQTDSDVLDQALRDNFNISLGDLETVFISNLDAQLVTADIRTDLELTVSNFDAVRRYQSLFDPSAYFLTAWLPDGQVMREMGIVADLTRRPRTWQNWLVERLLIRIHADLFSSEYEAAARDIKWTDWVLDVLAP